MIFTSELTQGYTDDFLVFRLKLIVFPIKLNSFLFCCESDFVVSLLDDKQAKIIEALNSTSRHHNNIYFEYLYFLPTFESMMNQTYSFQL